MKKNKEIVVKRIWEEKCNRCDENGFVMGLGNVNMVTCFACQGLKIRFMEEDIPLEDAIIELLNNNSPLRQVIKNTL